MSPARVVGGEDGLVDRDIQHKHRQPKFHPQDPPVPCPLASTGMPLSPHSNQFP